ncbi:MAG: acyl-CoA dehydrogenase family protein [Microbacterium sp.]
MSEDSATKPILVDRRSLMNLLPDPGTERFRQEVRAWLEENVPSEPRPVGWSPDAAAFDREWQRTQFDGGWAGIAWDAEYGGRGLPLLEQVIWYEELVRAGAPRPSIFNVAISHAGPTLIMRGDERQKAFHLPLILRGDTPWCQGFSEPGAGSDLASLSTRGVVDGDAIVVTGQKIWTSYAQYADYCELLVRTDPAAGKHKGITWLILDMHLPGIDVRPITSLDGHPHNCEVFLDEVRVPLANVVGEVDNGWSVAMSTLAAERGPGFLDSRLSQIAIVEELIASASENGLIAEEAIADRLARARASAAALRSMAYFQISSAADGTQPGPETTAIRAFYVQTALETAQLGMDILNTSALEWSSATERWLAAFSEPIAGGTIDILRNIIGERVLGLPR